MKKSRWGIKIFLGLVCLLFMIVPKSYAHPHVFIDAKVGFVFDNHNLTEIEITWIFDEIYSSGLILDFDEDANGQFDQHEISVLRQDAFSATQDFQYFVRIFIDEDEFTQRQINRFSASIVNNQVVYTFSIACQYQPSSSDYTEIEVLIYDETYYIEMTIEDKNAVSFESIENVDYNYRMIENYEKAYYFDQIAPQGVILTFKDK